MLLTIAKLCTIAILPSRHILQIAFNFQLQPTPKQSYAHWTLFYTIAEKCRKMQKNAKLLCAHRSNFARTLNHTSAKLCTWMSTHIYTYIYTHIHTYIYTIYFSRNTPLQNHVYAVLPRWSDSSLQRNLYAPNRFFKC